MDKKKVTVTAVILASALVAGGVSMHANAAVKVNTHTAGNGNLVKITEVNGNVVSNASESGYAKIGGKIAKINVKAGDCVKKGDLILTYDTDEIDDLIALADYSRQEATGSYDNVIQTGGRNAGLYSEAKTTLEDLENRIAVVQATLDITRNALIEKQAAVANEGAKLQVSLIDWADQPESDEYENLQKLVAENAWAQQYDPSIVKMQQEISLLSEELASCKETKAQMVSQKAAGCAGLLTKGTREQVEAAKAANDLRAENTIEKLEEAKKGVRAGMSGVITDIAVSENETVGEGSLLFTIESTEDVVIRTSVNKYDIAQMEIGQKTTSLIKNREYTGKISRIEHMTGKDEGASVGVEVTLDSPDENLILGLETKVKVITDSVDDTLTIPMDALCSDESGDYVFTVRDRKAVKRSVETGIRNDDNVEITDGLNPGETVIWLDDAELAEGMVVRAD
ncbi:MAG: efflux RND transporter periplasmic adaptor subunit [Lachnospiraceae bacterium]|nr:efflux RND transporter periplasmic adaptor subunit [Lachnospiraceae bacterium]